MANMIDRTVVRLLPAIPKPIVRKVSNRYIAGVSLEEACAVVSKLNEQGKMATIDVLGEHLESAEQARALVDEYDAVFDAIERESLDSNVSIKLTALGLTIDRGLCLENAEAVVKHAAE